MKRYYIQTYNTEINEYSRITIEANNLESLDEEIERYINSFKNGFECWDYKIEILAVEEIEE